jgi:hypothetical protein
MKRLMMMGAFGLGVLAIPGRALAADAGTGAGTQPPSGAPAPATTVPPATAATPGYPGPETAAGGATGATTAPVRGLEFGARLGYGLPLGSIDGGTGSDFNKLFSNAIPVWLDAGYRFTPNWYAGLYFMYGVGSIASDASNGSGCNNPGVGCSIHDTRFGANVHYHVMPEASLDPWLGAGGGYEWVGFSKSSGNTSGGGGLSGWEFLNLQAGIDFRATPAFVFGPFVTLTLTQFDTASSDSGQSSGSASINNKALHEWLTIGARGAYDLKVM